MDLNLVGSGAIGSGLIAKVLWDLWKDRGKNVLPKDCEHRMELMRKKIDDHEQIISVLQRGQSLSEERSAQTEKRLDKGAADFEKIRVELATINKNLTILITLAKKNSSLFQG